MPRTLEQFDQTTKAAKTIQKAQGKSREKDGVYYDPLVRITIQTWKRCGWETEEIVLEGTLCGDSFEDSNGDTWTLPAVHLINENVNHVKVYPAYRNGRREQWVRSFHQHRWVLHCEIIGEAVSPWQD